MQQIFKLQNKNWSNKQFKFQALLVCLVAVAYVQAAPADESIIGDSVDAFHPSDDSEFSKKAIVKGLIILKVKKVKKLFKG